MFTATKPGKYRILLSIKPATKPSGRRVEARYTQTWSKEFMVMGFGMTHKDVAKHLKAMPVRPPLPAPAGQRQGIKRFPVPADASRLPMPKERTTIPTGAAMKKDKPPPPVPYSSGHKLGDDVFVPEHVNPIITKVSGALGKGGNLAPGKLLVIEGMSLGKTKGHVYLKGPFENETVVALLPDPMLWETGVVIVGMIPPDIQTIYPTNGDKTLDVYVKVRRSDNAESDWFKSPVPFDVTREMVTKLLAGTDSAVTVLHCGDDSNADWCNDQQPDSTELCADSGFVTGTAGSISMRLAPGQSASIRICCLRYDIFAIWRRPISEWVGTSGNTDSCIVTWLFLR